jgi:hypothetical protein
LSTRRKSGQRRWRKKTKENNNFAHSGMPFFVLQIFLKFGRIYLLIVSPKIDLIMQCYTCFMGFVVRIFRLDGWLIFCCVFQSIHNNLFQEFGLVIDYKRGKSIKHTRWKLWKLLLLSFSFDLLGGMHVGNYVLCAKLPYGGHAVILVF